VAGMEARLPPPIPHVDEVAPRPLVRAYAPLIPAYAPVRAYDMVAAFMSFLLHG